MSTDVPLKLRLDPGEYQCYASLPDTTGAPVRLSGLLNLLPNRPPELSLHGNVPAEATISSNDGVISYTYPQVSHLPLLAVDLVRGNDVLLLDCTIEKWAPQRAVVTAAAAFVGVTISPVEDNLQVNRLTIQVSGADAVTAPPPLQTVTFPIKREPDVPISWVATERLPRRVTDTDDGAELSAYWYVSFSGNDGYSHRVSFSPVIEISLTEPIDLDTLRHQWLEPLRRIVGLSTGRAETITYLTVELVGDENRELQGFGFDITQQPYAPRGNDLLKIKPAFQSYGDDAASLLKLCRGWQRAQADRHPLVETLGTFLSLPAQHPRARFLLLIQALEGLHGHHNAEQFNARLDCHQEARKRAREAVKGCDKLDPEVRKFIRDNLPNRPPSSLEDALKALLNALPVDLIPRLSELDLVTSLVADNQADDWASALRVVRNGLSHGSRSWTAGTLEPAAQLLETIARAHLMRVVRVDERSIKAYLEHRI